MIGVIKTIALMFWEQDNTSFDLLQFKEQFLYFLQCHLYIMGECIFDI